MEYPRGYVKGLPNCGIVAISAITGAEYQPVWDWFKSRNKRLGQWRGATFSRDYLDALAAFGKTGSKKIFDGSRFNKTLGAQRPVPLHYWIGIYSKKFPRKKFLVSSHNHTMAVDENGIVLDPSGIGPALEHKSKGRRITEAWIVE